MHNLWCYVVKLSQRLRSDYDIREIDEDLYLAVLQAARQSQLGFSGNLLFSAGCGSAVMTGV